MSEDPLLSIVIPTFNEQDYIGKTLDALERQTVFPQSEIIIADHDPAGNGLTRKAIAGRDRVFYVHVRGSGIAHARNIGAKNSMGRYITCFDADSVFSHDDTLELMINGIASNPEKRWGTLDSRFPDNEIPPHHPGNLFLVNTCLLNRTLPVGVLEPGLTMPREFFNAMKGFSDVRWAEGLELTGRILLHYGANAKFFLENRWVIMSARRALSATKNPLEALDYTNAIRGDKILPVK